jgi:hypothetical protein
MPHPTLPCIVHAERNVTMGSLGSDVTLTFTIALGSSEPLIDASVTVGTLVRMCTAQLGSSLCLLPAPSCRQTIRGPRTEMVDKHVGPDPAADRVCNGQRLILVFAPHIAC